MRRLHTRVLTAAAAAALAAGGLGACSVIGHKRFTDDAALRQRVTSIRIDNENGAVTVDASAGATGASVHRTVDYTGAKPSGTSFHVAAGVLTLSGCGRRCGVDYVVTVPAGLPVTGGTTNSDVTLTRVGAVDVHTSNGRIAVDGATGAVTVRTTNSGVDVRDAGGDVDAQTSNGGVTISTDAPRNVRARTSNSDLTVTVPPAAYRVTAGDSDGEKKLAYADDPSGRYRLDLSTTNGDLTLDRADG
jgi:hypothetical protein